MLVKTIKAVGNVLYVILVVFFVIAILGAIFSSVKAPFGSRVYVVQSGSMEPSVKLGSVVITKPQKSYAVNDVITFSPANTSAFELPTPKDTVTHRIVSVNSNDGQTSYETKGDANQTKDNQPVAKSQVLGKVMLDIPYAGYAVSFIRTKPGFILLVIVPAILFILSEIYSVRNELFTFLKIKKEHETP